MKIKHITNYLERHASLKLQESYDNCGLIVGNEESEVTSILTTLDVTENVVEEAIIRGCNLIIAHHPIVFFGLKKFSTNTYVERTILKAIKNGIAIYAIHTNLDKIYDGVNQKILHKIGIKETNSEQFINNRFLKYNTDDASWVSGSGMIGKLEKPEFAIDFLERMKTVFHCEMIRHTSHTNRLISKIAVCGGAGFSLLEDAIKHGADIFLTADVSYHQFFDADNKIILADIGHYESEQFTKELLKELIDGIPEHSTVTKPNVIISSLNTNPVNYI